MKFVMFAMVVLLGFSAPRSMAADGSAPIGEPSLEMPTCHSLGTWWIIRGDDNRNARVDVEYRKPGGAWRKGAPLFRVEKGAQKQEKGQVSLSVPADAWLFAGSVLLLDEDTEYELKLSLIDPDGGNVQRLLKCRTNAEPRALTNAPQYHVSPGTGGGDGSAARPFLGLSAAQKSAKPGDVFLLHAGVYEGIFTVRRNGQPGKPIVWRAAGDGEAIIDAKCPREKLVGAAIEASGSHDVWFEGLTICNAFNAIRAADAQRIVVRRCHLRDFIVGVVAAGNKSRSTSGLFISDNLIEGFMPWPTTHEQWESLPECRGVWITGRGHEVCYNRIHHCKDGVDTGESLECCAIDFHHNDISEMFDDGTEMDGSHRNTRCFMNRYANTLTGVSLQPVYGGPVYVFRNVMYNFKTEAFKLHNSPSGGVLIHNTAVHNGPALQLATAEKVRHCYSRNNLFIGTTGRAMDYSPPMIDCDYDYDGFGGFSGNIFIKWNNVRYASPADVRAKAPVYKHVIVVDPAMLFAGGAAAPADNQKIYDLSKIDLRLRAGSAAIDAGEKLDNFNDDFQGAAPDLGAYEFGSPVPHYGPR